MAAEQGFITILQQNPVVLWGGIVLALIIYLISKNLENREEDELEAPRPSSLDEIVKPKIREHMENRGVQPKSPTVFKIGRDVKGEVTKYLDTELPSELLDPNPNKSKDSPDPEDMDKSDLEGVRIISIDSTGVMDQIKAFFLMLVGNQPQENERFYVFREESFLDTPGPDMVVDPDVLSYNFAGIEVEISDSARNVINQAVQTEVSESVLAALPNYTEKVDFLFPLHSQEITKTREEGEHLHGDEGF